MNRFVGLSLLCLIFASTQAATDVSGSSWSLHMSQNNGEPIQVKSERKEYDRTGVILHRKTRGIIENGVYKTISEQDLTNPSSRKSRDIDDLVKLADQYEKGKKGSEKGERRIKRRPSGFFGFNGGEGWPQIKFHPRRYGKGFKKLKEDFDETAEEDFEGNSTESSAENFREDFGENYGQNKTVMHRHHPHGNFGFGEDYQTMQEPPMNRYALGHHPAKFDQREQRGLRKFARTKQHSQDPMEFADSTSDSMKKRLGNRSRVSFYRPVEKLFEKLFGSKKQKVEKTDDFKRNPMTSKPMKQRPTKQMDRDFSKRDNWFEDFERQNRTLTREILRDMQDFENDFFADGYYGAEE